MTIRLNSTNPIVDDQGRATTEFFRALGSFVTNIVTAEFAKQAAAAAAQAAVVAQDTAETAQATADTKQPQSASLDALAALGGTGLIEQTGANAFTNRAIGVAGASSIPTRADADARYVGRDGAAAPAYSAYGGQTVGAAYAQAQAQTTDDAVKAASAAVVALITELRAIHALT